MNILEAYKKSKCTCNDGVSVRQYLDPNKESDDVENLGSGEEMGEALKGDQHKIDHDKDGNIEASDLAMLRAKKKIKTEEEKKDPCWKGYKQIGMKDKDGKKVPNCVPESVETDHNITSGPHKSEQAAKTKAKEIEKKYGVKRFVVQKNGQWHTSKKQVSESVEEIDEKVQHKMTVGQKVVHSKHGEGTIKDIVADPDGGKQQMFSVKFNDGKSQLHYGEELKIKSIAGDLDESLQEGMSVEQVEKYIGFRHPGNGIIDVYYSGQHFVRVFETDSGFTWQSVHQFCKLVLGIIEYSEVPYSLDTFETEAEAVIDAIEMFHELGAFKEVDFDLTESMKEPETTKDKTDVKLPAPVKGGKLHGEIPAGFKPSGKKMYGSMKEEMTDAQMSKREKIVKSMKKSKGDFEQRYGDKAKSVMYATATKMAMKEEQVDEASNYTKNGRFSYNKAEFNQWAKKKEAEKKAKAAQQVPVKKDDNV